MPVKPRTTLPDFRGFVQVELTEDDIGTIEASVLKLDTIFDAILGTLSQGYRFAIAQEPDGFAFKATLMDTDTSRTSSGYMLSGSGPSPSLACAVLLFKHMAKMGGNWTPFLTKSAASHGLR